ncbi:hypothetical protein IMZ48_15595 [Candidatus Bathyarchaeota archaeon]|nr:hypothetical protein [Candidatus Bathyarchaeota archaeon]
MYPSVGLKKYGEHIRTNFGQAPFVFNIDGMMKVSLAWARVRLCCVCVC